ncbi:hypothetical protein C4D60_Mb10t24110 [Musa balbisiana]|uniref:SHSP domain-containing protein n=1 Tax=Musa balbisiana TaxID=52838 RepID=A0A4S8J0V4_MUSBA|nr:hypothetical protein C4D60_Mb10t24110 [Musa balbisiana]
MGHDRKWEASVTGDILTKPRAPAEVRDAFRLSDNADLDSVSIKLEDSVLMVMLPKLASKKIKGPWVVSIASSNKEKLQGSNSERLKRWSLKDRFVVFCMVEGGGVEDRGGGEQDPVELLIVPEIAMILMNKSFLRRDGMLAAVEGGRWEVGEALLGNVAATVVATGWKWG